MSSMEPHITMYPVNNLPCCDGLPTPYLSGPTSISSRFDTVMYHS